MPQKRRKSAYVWLWVLALAALSAAISITHYKIGDSDYYWHCMYGQILATTHKMPTTDPVSWLAAESGLHYIDYSCFCDLLLYKLSLLGPIETYGGLLFFLLFSIPVTILIFDLWGQGVIQRLQQGWQTALLSLAILVGCLVLQLPADPCSRPKLVSLLLFILSVYWIQKPGFKCFPTIFIAILWANLHGTALPALFILQAGALFLDVLPTSNANCLQFTHDKNWSPHLLILLLSILAGGINPYGFRLYSQLAEIQRANKIIHITELSPSTLNLSASTFAARQSSAAMILLLLLLVYLILCPHKIPAKNLLPVAMTGCMMLLHVRFIGWFFAALTIFILQEADRLLPICEVSNKHARPQCAILAASILGSVLWCTFQFAPTAENARPIRYPSETLLEVIAAQNPQHLYSSAIGTGTFFAYNGTPCFVDSRIELYPSEVLHDFRVLEGSVPYTDTTIDYFGPIIDKYQFDMMVLCQHDNVGLTAYMSQRSDWQLIYTSSVYAVFVPHT